MYLVQRFTVALLGLGLSACGQVPYTTGEGNANAESQDPVAAMVPEVCGAKLTTQRRGVNGRALQGINVTSGTVTRATRGCQDVADLHLEGTTLVGNLGDKALRGHDFIGTTVTQVDPAGGSVSAVIAGIETDPRDSTGETLLYTLRTQDPVTGQIADLCAPDADGLRRAIPVSGTWDVTGAHTSSTTQFTFGCTSAAIGKCVRLGYRPWQSFNGTSLESYHQACTRMVRFDYCGDGGARTEDGTEIDAYDRLGVNLKDSGLLMLFDGAWTPDGAYCIERQRWLRLSLMDILTLRTLLPSECLAKFELTVLESSPVDPLDLCAVRRRDLSRDAVLMDNRSGINLHLSL